MKLIECPRDAMQGLHDFIPTKEKVAYLNQLLKVGFDTIDFGSFVSPKAIPQMRDTHEVIDMLDLDTSRSKLLAIVANVRGAQQAAEFSSIQYQGFPLSLSETFQQRNTNKSIAQAMDTVKAIQEICENANQTLVTYLSMGFGNPYGDPWSAEFISEFVQELSAIGVRIVSLADTIGVSNEALIGTIFLETAANFPDIEFGVHLHSTPETAYSKIEAAIKAGCKRLDGAILGIGGCPMAKDDLTGNIAMETIMGCLDQQGIDVAIDKDAWAQALHSARELFGTYR